MVEWRLDDAVLDDAFRALPRRGSCRSSDQPGELRLDLYRALYGAAQGRQGRIRAVGRDQISGQAAWVAAAGAWHKRRQCALPEQHSDDQCADQRGETVPADGLSEQD